jgi:putative polyhydroxyalkanoate system protein
MPRISIQRQHALSGKAARKALDQLAAKFSEDFSLSTRWVENVLHFERLGVKGAITLADKAVDVQADLSFLMTPIKGRIEAEIDRYMSEIFKA